MGTSIRNPDRASERLVENELTGSPSGENSSPDGEQTQGGRTGAAEAFRTAWGAFAGTLTVSPARATTFALRGSTRF